MANQNLSVGGVGSAGEERPLNVADAVAAAAEVFGLAGWGGRRVGGGGGGKTEWRPPVALRAVAGALDGERARILDVTERETGLTGAELAPEFARMVGVLRMMADVAERGEWVRATIDRASAAAVGPGHDVRRTLVPLGPVAVFGASNFPLAYGVCGGDTASALGAGCPVVVKEHPAHPVAGRLIWSVARAGLRGAGVPAGVLGYVGNEDAMDHGPARSLVTHPAVAAVGFTGSLGGGRALVDLAMRRPVPIPVFAEMGSCNRVWVSRRAAARRGEEIGRQLADSILMRFGQQCTKPGIVVVEGVGDAVAAAACPVIATLAGRVAAAAGRDLLAPWVRGGYVQRIERLRGAKGVVVLARGEEKAGARGAGAWLFWADGEADRGADATVHEEVFGPAAVVMPGHASVEGVLASSVYAEPEDVAEGKVWVDGRAGRVAFNGVPTGVRAAWGMVHGGPWPSTNRPETTAVGPMAMERWCRPVCYQGFPEALLPDELKDGNPMGIGRIVDGRWEAGRFGNRD